MRAQRLIDGLEGAGIELMLVTNLVNVRYLTGYTGSNGMVLVGSDTRVFITDFRYTEQAAEEVESSFQRLTVSQDLITSVGDHLPQGSVRLGFEDAHISVKEYARIRELLPDRVELVPVTGLVETLRLVKDEGEIELIAHATKIADDAMAALLEAGVIGRTERELALTLEHDMRWRGADEPSFRSIVAAGPHGALPHAEPRDVKVQRGQLVTFDWGARYQGYCSDCTRTIAAGEPSDAAREAYELVLRAQLKGLAEVRAGGDGRQIDRTVRDIIDDAGHQEHYGHGLGHGVGLEIHESPRLSKLSTDTLAAGNVVTVEPGVYVPGQFGIRIEDLVVVGDQSNRILTSLPKELRVVG